jgi:hypothetical protein
VQYGTVYLSGLKITVEDGYFFVEKICIRISKFLNLIYLKVEFITCFGGDSDPEGLNGSARKKKKKKKKRGKKVYREPIGRKLRQSCIQCFFSYFSVADPGCLSRIRIFSIPDPGSRSEFFQSRISIKEFNNFNPKNDF